MTTSSHKQRNHFTSFWWRLVLPVYMGWRVWWANRMPIMDCDEVYNYWEPLHFMLFGTGLQTWEYAQQFALRTYAYLLPLATLSKYILLPLLQRLPPSISSLVSLLAIHDVSIITVTNDDDGNDDHYYHENRLALMVILRAFLAASMALAEVAFLEALANYKNESSTLSEKPTSTNKSSSTSTNDPSSSSVNTTYTQNLSLVTAWLMITSTGMSHASGALLPSTTLTMVWLWAARAYLKRQFVTFVAWAVLATLAIGWPFGVILFVPIGMACLVQQYQEQPGAGGLSRVVWLLSCALGTAIVVQGIVSAIDYSYYDRWVSPVYNILRYNTLAQGDELYGVEPTSYYVKNLVLNFNYVAVAGVAGGPAVVVMLLLRYKNGNNSNVSNINHQLLLWDLFVLTLPMYVWLGIVIPRPHKEERFLFPIYPILCLSAAVVGGAVLEGVFATFSSSNNSNSSEISTELSSPKPRWFLWLQLLAWTPAAFLGGSRTIALSKYYSAPLEIYAQFQKEQPLLSRTLVNIIVKGEDGNTEDSAGTMTTTTVCTCGEWYRFPSSFYLPGSTPSGSSTTIVNFKFVSPSPYFEGQLPHAFLAQGSGLGASYTAFNDKNMPEYDDRYVPIDACDYLVDATWNEVQEEHHDNQVNTSCRDNDSHWLPISKRPFLDADRTSSLHRILYLPMLHEQADLSGGVEYVDYILYRRTQDGDDIETEEEYLEEEEDGTHSPRA